MRREMIEPKWLSGRYLQLSTLPKGLVDWLFGVGSLTQKMQKNYLNFRINVLANNWQLPRVSEILKLEFLRPHLAMIREVELIGDDQVKVFARSIFPRLTLTGKNRILSRLGSRSLGDVLFHDPSVQRMDFEFARLRSGHADYEQAIKSLSFKPLVLWGRRSVFKLDGQPLLVSEIFLPTLYD